MLFDLPPILGLAPLILYIILAFKKNMHPFETHRIGALYKNLWNSTFPCISRIPAIFKKIIPHANPRNSA